MTNGNTVVSYRLPTSELYSSYLYFSGSYQKYLAVRESGGCRRAQEGAGERAIKTLPSLVRKCTM